MSETPVEKEERLHWPAIEVMERSNSLKASPASTFASTFEIESLVDFMFMIKMLQ